MKTSRTIMLIPLACLGATANAQTTLAWTDPAWQDFGTYVDTSATGNFFPAWTTINGTPDVGLNTFGFPNTSLSGAPDETALWLVHLAPPSPLAVSNEVAELSLDGFTIGEQYELGFWATLARHTGAGWDGNNDSLDIAITGADIADFDTTVLSDPIADDGLNTWEFQLISFTALSTAVEFQFGANAVWPAAPATAYRFGVDGFSMRRVPTPASPAVLALAAGAMAGRRRRMTAEGC